MTVTREQLELAWVRATTLDDLDSPLTMAIIQEALDGGGDLRETVVCLNKILEDVEGLVNKLEAL